MSVTHPDQIAFLAAISEKPDDDTPRLALADWLDELPPVRVVCPNTGRGCTQPAHNCPACHGVGTVICTANADLAAFIRVQVGLERQFPGWLHAVVDPAISDSDYDRFRIREDALLAAHRDHWLRAGACPRCQGSRWLDTGGNHSVSCQQCDNTGDVGMLCGRIGGGEVDITAGRLAGGPRYPVTFERGFPHSVAVPRLSDVYAECTVVCPRCGGDMRINQHHDAASDTWRGGRTCPTCDGGGTARQFDPTPRVLAWLRHFPTVQRIVCADRVPFDWQNTTDEDITPNSRYAWLLPGHGEAARESELPEPLWAEVVKNGNGWLNPEDAVDALAETIVKVTRNALAKEGKK